MEGDGCRNVISCSQQAEVCNLEINTRQKKRSTRNFLYYVYECGGKWVCGLIHEVLYTLKSESLLQVTNYLDSLSIYIFNILTQCGMNTKSYDSAEYYNHCKMLQS